MDKRILIGLGVLGVIGFIVYKNKGKGSSNANSPSNSPNNDCEVGYRKNNKGVCKKLGSGLEDVFTINNNDLSASNPNSKAIADCRLKKGYWQPSSGGGFCQFLSKPPSQTTTIQKPPSYTPSVSVGSYHGGGSNTIDDVTQVYGNPTDTTY
jgi:hypothetical protein